MNIIQELEKYRLENKISQAKIAAMLGITFATANRWFKGHSKPSKIQTYHIEKLIKGGR
jgi:transcriptional regulator with XRE-family HTH domain